MLRTILAPLVGALLFAGCANTYECGDTHCNEGQYCEMSCGPAGGVVHSCEDAQDGCDDCTCLVLTAAQTCTMVDGRPEVRTEFPCF